MNQSDYPKLAFIGAGNMARSIVGGLVEQGYPAERIRASDRGSGSARALAEQTGIGTGENAELAEWAEVVVLAAKPQGLRAVAQSLAGSSAHRPLFISIAAGVNTASLARWLGEDQAIVRCMPNTPSLVKVGASALYANRHTDAGQRERAERILSAVSRVRWLENEAQMDAVTAVSGSGPAYFFLVIESMIDAGEALGLDRETATDLAQQTALGAATLARQSDLSAEQLRRQVMSPGGTTEAAIESFERDDLRGSFRRAMEAAARRSAELAGNSD